MTDKKRVLVVDDDPDFCDIVQSKLEKLNLSVEIAYNGVEGMEKVRKSPPDLIVLDVMMPEKDGFQMCKELKADPELSEIPVVMLTAVAEHIADTGYTQYDAMSMEADDYIAKGPDCSNQVTKSVQEFLEL